MLEKIHFVFLIVVAALILTSCCLPDLPGPLGIPGV